MSNLSENQHEDLDTAKSCLIVKTWTRKYLDVAELCVEWASSECHRYKKLVSVTCSISIQASHVSHHTGHLSD